MEQIEITELISKLKSGCHDAFETVYNLYRKQVFMTAYGFLSNRESAMDVVQETFIKVLKHRKTIKDGSKLAPWIMTIARNLSLDYYRKAKRESHRITTSVDEAHDLQSDSNPEQTAINQIEKESLLSALHELSDREKEVFSLKYFNGFTFKEIGEILEVKEGTVKTLHHRAIQKLKQIILKKRGENE